MKRLMLLPAIACLLVGLASGLLRLGWEVPVPNYDVLIAHGSLMVCGFLGTLICLERAAGLQVGWGYAVPLLPGAAGLCQVFRPDLAFPLWLHAAGGAGLVALYVRSLRIRADLASAIQFCGAAMWLVGNTGLAARWPLHAVVPWWMAFIVLTVAGERLELSRYLAPGRRAKAAFCLCASLLAAGCFAWAAAMQWERTAPIQSRPAGDFTTAALGVAGGRLCGLGLLGLSLWLLRHDMAWRSLSRGGQSRYIGLCLLSGHTWLGISGLSFALRPGAIGGLPYDAALHAAFLGFAVSMIFGHALIILPAVAGIAVPFHGGFYVPLAVLHGSVALRVASDLSGFVSGRSWAGPLHAAAFVLFALTVLSAAGLARLQAKTPSPAGAPR